MPIRIDDTFGRAVRKVLDSRGLSTRAAMYKTHIDNGTILRMRHGQVPRKGAVIDFATALGEDINHWLKLAGYKPIPADLVTGPRTKQDVKRYVKESWPELPGRAADQVADIIKQGLEDAESEDTQ